ncbi:hypothetical protein [Piscirickettsia litoralis]|uniref:Uncharacterized protein n=1 Tax=Piscirickettsia litoralis TaxID=1891921 RepID=A0ABX3A8V7_9GAMM|nr:hypothetical protein [Piscirickettsia litoralis]ODN44078.1 hypothetical protein BGC07_11165 [Piscirickettsia litoralis]
MDDINIKKKLLEEMKVEQHATEIARYISSILREQLEDIIAKRPKVKTTPVLMTLTAECQVRTLTSACLKAFGALANRFVDEKDLEEMFLSMLQVHSDFCLQALQDAYKEKAKLNDNSLAE